MKELRHMIHDPMGLHARPAGMLVKKLKEYTCAVTLTYGEKAVDAKKLFAIMGLAVKTGQEITLTFDGPDAEEAAAATEAFLQENL